MLSAVLLSLTLASCYAFAGARARLAPADEYFGRTKMSILEIGNRLREMSFRAARQIAPQNVLHDGVMTEDALSDWERKYPADPWLAKDLAQLVHVYSELSNPAASRRMHACLTWLERRYASRRGLIAAARVEAAIADARLHNIPSGH